MLGALYVLAGVYVCRYVDQRTGYALTGWAGTSRWRLSLLQILWPIASSMALLGHRPAHPARVDHNWLERWVLRGFKSR